VELLLTDLSEQNYDVALELAGLARKLRGFGHVKDRNREKLALHQVELFNQFYSVPSVSGVHIIEAD
jgi:indolepyruvate ferredoxin oxidoreductase